jgi:hypothetical protein
VNLATKEKPCCNAPAESRPIDGPDIHTACSRLTGHLAYLDRLETQADTARDRVAEASETLAGHMDHLAWNEALWTPDHYGAAETVYIPEGDGSVRVLRAVSVHELGRRVRDAEEEKALALAEPARLEAEVASVETMTDAEVRVELAGDGLIRGLLEIGLGAPTTGHELFRWAKQQEQWRGVGLLRHLNRWSKFNDFPARMGDWDAESVELAYAECIRWLGAEAGAELAGIGRAATDDASGITVTGATFGEALDN